jgi:hypothetical protein
MGASETKKLCFFRPLILDFLGEIRGAGGGSSQTRVTLLEPLGSCIYLSTIFCLSFPPSSYGIVRSRSKIANLFFGGERRTEN